MATCSAKIALSKSSKSTDIAVNLVKSMKNAYQSDYFK